MSAFVLRSAAACAVLPALCAFHLVAATERPNNAKKQAGNAKGSAKKRAKQAE